MSPLSHMCLAETFFRSVACLFISLKGSFKEQKFLILMNHNLVIYFLLWIAHYGIISKNFWTALGPKYFISCFFFFWWFYSFMFKFITNFQLIFLEDERFISSLRISNSSSTTYFFLFLIVFILTSVFTSYCYQWFVNFNSFFK